MEFKRISRAEAWDLIKVAIGLFPEQNITEVSGIYVRYVRCSDYDCTPEPKERSCTFCRELLDTFFVLNSVDRFVTSSITFNCDGVDDKGKVLDSSDPNNNELLDVQLRLNECWFYLRQNHE